MIAGERCPLCGGSGVPVDYPPHVGLRTCCDTLLSFPWASEADYEAWYSGASYHVDQQADEGLPDTVSRDSEHQRAALSRLRTMDALGLSGSLLDVGAAMGSFVTMAEAYGWSAFGVEPSAAMVRQAQALGRNVALGSATEIPAGRFDVVCAFDVLEHLTRPGAALRSMAAAVRPGGCLIIEMPEFKAPFGNWQRHIRPRQHIALYSAAAAVELFTRAGLRLEALIRPKRGQLAKAVYYLFC